MVWELDLKEGWELKNWRFWIGALEKTLESPLDSKEIKSVNPRGNQPWIFIGRTDAEAEARILWPPDVKSWLNGKHPDSGKDGWRGRRGWQRMRWLDGITGSGTWVCVNSTREWRTGKPGLLQSMGLQSLTWVNDSTTTNRELPCQTKTEWRWKGLHKLYTFLSNSNAKL